MNPSKRRDQFQYGLRWAVLGAGLFYLATVFASHRLSPIRAKVLALRFGEGYARVEIQRSVLADENLLAEFESLHSRFLKNTPQSLGLKVDSVNSKRYVVPREMIPERYVTRTRFSSDELDRVAAYLYLDDRGDLSRFAIEEPRQGLIMTFGGAALFTTNMITLRVSDEPPVFVYSRVP
jgi:hypothetical protein